MSTLKRSLCRALAAETSVPSLNRALSVMARIPWPVTAALSAAAIVLAVRYL